MDISKNTALERLEEFVHKIPDNNAVISEPDEKLTFRELWDLSGKIYAWLKGKGIGAEDVVMYCLPRGLMERFFLNDAYWQPLKHTEPIT